MQAPDLGSVQCCCSRTLLLGLCLSSTARYLRPDHFKNWATLTCVSCILSQDACVRTEAKSAYCPLGMQRSAAVNKKQLRWRLLWNRNSLRYLIHGFIVMESVTFHKMDGWMDRQIVVLSSNILMFLQSFSLELATFSLFFRAVLLPNCFLRMCFVY